MMVPKGRRPTAKALPLGASLLAVVLPWGASAFPSYGLRVPNGKRVRCPEGIAGCTAGEAFLCQPTSVCTGLGHANCVGGTLPLNPFGEALAAHNFSWTRELCEADSDGDGLTNGEELGDPCCLWEESDEPSDYTKAFAATHPGFAEKAADAASYARPATCQETAPSVKAVKMNHFNEGEVQKSLDIHIDHFPIPAKRTTYVDTGFNWPDESEDLFHIVFAHVLIDKKKNLHHFLIRACTEKFPDEYHGKPVERNMLESCGGHFGGWAPGANVLETPPWLGVPIGRGAGIVAWHIQVHYDNPDFESGIVDSSGIRIYYTPTLRPEARRSFSVAELSVNPLLVIPAGERRWFLTRTCKLDVTKQSTGEPAKFHLYGVSYHAHLLGREMYAELKAAGEDESQDLASEPIWHFDDQGWTNIAPWNISLQTGDTLQTTCVMDSRSRSTYTDFGQETVDEMCWMMLSGWPGDTRLQCTGEFWSGSLLEGEPGFGLAQRHPMVNASTVFDGTDAMFGGEPIRVDVAEWPCEDSSYVRNYCAMVTQFAAGAGCDAAIPIPDNVLGLSSIELCCASMCELVCPEHPRCNQTGLVRAPEDGGSAAERTFDVQGIREPRCWTPALGTWGAAGAGGIDIVEPPSAGGGGTNESESTTYQANQTGESESTASQAPPASAPRALLLALLAASAPSLWGRRLS